MPSNERLLAVPIVPAYHASTALEQLLMSSSHLTTLCSAGSWQCESKWILNHFDEGGRNGRGKSWETYIEKIFPRSEPPEEKKEPTSSSNESQIWRGIKDFSFWWERRKTESSPKLEPPNKNRITVEKKSLDIFSQYWNLSRRVLLVKRPTNGTDLIPGFIDPFENSGIPEAMKSAGIDTLKVVYLIMWRPICLSKLSSHAQDSKKYVNHELFLLEQSLQAYRYLKEHGHRVMAINLGDLLWNREHVRERLYSAMPCLGQLQFDYKPEIGKDVTECNKFKANSSIEEFADKINSVDFGFDSASGTCNMNEEDSDVSRHLPPLQRERIQKTMLELAALSRL